MIDLKTLRELVKLMVGNDLTELDVQDPKGGKVSLKRGRGDSVHYVPAPAASPAIHAPAPSASASPAAAAPSAPAAESNLPQITSPMVGTFYSAASPDAKPFVKPGDKVTADTVVCIIEAMKVFNEIKAERAGTIEKLMVTSGQAVEFGQPLFLIKP
ncbi:MAG: acetyl-CoA carboxylase biotin carboxyl carrier protein, partial [Planctomycetota bacterium]|nr:acetyl-CoA carboxylase biotin carboxyl carrier protein [Planctomycetota bacterium]